ncbi:MAG TPA: sialidase family protein [Candidatus Limnocylindria bacterium]|nr:sialidase family protein [Candidatus Limnocylindria bacterium]
MSLRHLIAPVSIAAIVLGSIVLDGRPALAAGQTVTATVLLPSNGGGVARREWTASGGAVNGVNGYVITLDPATVGTYFTLGLASTNTGAGAPSIAFYTDMTNGITCGTFDGNPGAAGVVCGDHAIVYLLAGANVTFAYQSGLPVPPPPAFVASKFTFSAPIALPFPAGAEQGNIGEPSVDVDPSNDNIYVTSPTGIPCGASNAECVVFWRSTDEGATFTQPAPNAFLSPLGGGDSDVIHDGLGNVFAADLRSLVYTGVWRSVDQGDTWTSTDMGPCSDRQWIAWGGPNAPTGPLTIYETQNSGACVPGALFQFWRSIDDGQSFLPVGVVGANDLSQLGYTADATVQGAVEAKLAVDQLSGAIYIAWATQAIEDATGATTRILVVSRSADGGATWTSHLAYAGPLGTSIQNLFPVIAIDHGGNAYAAFSTQLSGQNMGVYLVTSTDRGASWSAAQRVNPVDQTAVFPAIAAGDNGRVDLTWIGTPGTTVSDPTNQWNIFFGQSRNADKRSPRWSTGQISTQVMHRGDICNRGLNCNIFGGNRDLADFITVAIDADGNANAVWTDDASQPTKAIMFSKQIGGPRTGKLPPKS